MGVELRILRHKKIYLLACTAGLLFLLGFDDSKQVPRVVDAEKFVLRDANGKVWAEFGLQSGRPSLSLLDEKGVWRARLALLEDGSSQLSFQDGDGHRKACLNVPSEGEPQLEIEKEHGMPASSEDESTKPVAKPRTATAENPAIATLYRELCISCHGADGRGRKSRSRATIPDFTDANWHKRHSDSQIIAAILNGRGDGMPAFAGRVTKQRARDLATYIRALGPNEPAKPVNHVDDFESRLRQLQRQWDELDREVKALSEPQRRSAERSK